MKNKFGIKTRVFLSFGFLIIIFTNIFATFLYIFVERSFINNLQKNLNKEYENIKEIIDTNDSDIINISEEENKRIDDLGLFYVISSDNELIDKNYLIGTYRYEDNIIFRGNHNGYNVLIGKNVLDLDRFKRNIIDTTIFLNIFGLFITLIISYFITNRVLKPLIKLSKFISNYDINENKTIIINKYGSSEIGLITNSLNKFIGKTKELIDSQKDFIQDASHELKTPLMQIESNIELIEDKIDDEKIKEKLENIKQSTQNINNIISNLGFILRGEEEKYEKQEIDLNLYLIDLIKDFEIQAKQKNIDIKINKFSDLIISNNKYYLDRLFNNLINNSIFYNNGNSEIIINIYENKIEIIDFGIGIEEKEIKKIFSRFYRSKNSNLFNKNGNGLGLTIVKKICDNFNWKIKIESKVGKTTKITLTLK